MVKMTDVVLNPGQHDDIDSVVEQAKLVDELGFERISMGEANGWNIIPIQTLIANQTNQLGLSNDVFSPFSRSPALLAQTAAALYEITDGRYRIGLGPSSPALANKWHGRSFDRPLTQVREAVDIFRQAISGERLDYDGEFFRVSDLKLQAPVPQETVPVDIAALGPQAVKQAGRLADGWIPQFFTPDGLQERISDLKSGLSEADRSPSDIRVAFSIRCCVMDNPDRARERTREHIAFLIGAYGPYYYESLCRQGFENEANEIRENWREGNRDEAVEAVSERLLNELAAAGTLEDVLSTLERFNDIDELDTLRLSFPMTCSVGEQNETLRALSGTVDKN